MKMVYLPCSSLVVSIFRGAGRSLRAGIFPLFVVGCTLALSGCILAPIIGSVKDSGVTESDRRRLLSERVTHYHQMISFNRIDAAIAMAEKNYRETLRQELQLSAKVEKIIGAEIETIEWSEDSFAGKARVNVRYFRVPIYVIEDRIETETWNFSLTDGWKIAGKTIENSA